MNDVAALQNSQPRVYGSHIYTTFIAERGNYHVSKVVQILHTYVIFVLIGLFQIHPFTEIFPMALNFPFGVLIHKGIKYFFANQN